MAGGQRLISWLHPCSTSNVALNTHTGTHGPLMGHPNWVECDTCATGPLRGAVEEEAGAARWGRGRRRRLALTLSTPKEGSTISLAAPRPAVLSEEPGEEESATWRTGPREVELWARALGRTRVCAVASRTEVAHVVASSR
jgi:hypothetical protein